MLINPTITKLREMRLNTMAETLENPSDGIAGLDFEERFAMMVEKEWLARHNRRVNNLIKAAGFTQSASLEDIKWKGRNPELRPALNALGGTNFIEKKLNVLISGETGCGKSFMACALGNAACRQMKKTRFVRMPELLIDLDEARNDGRYSKYMDTLKKCDLLIIDDIGLKTYSLEESRDIMEIFEARYTKGSLILASQLPPDKWYELFPNPTIADGIMDRIIHNSYRLDMKAKDSMRKIMAEEIKKDLGIG